MLSTVIKSAEIAETERRKAREDCRNMNDAWREQLTKHIPGLAVMFFAGPHATAKWIGERHLRLSTRVKELEEDKKEQRRNDAIKGGPLA